MLKLLHIKINKTTLLFLLFFVQYSFFAQSDFVTTWLTTNPGVTSDSSIKISTFQDEVYNYDVDWNNDGVFDEFGITGDVVHTYSSPGSYTVRIRGLFPRIFFNNQDDVLKIIAINQWGSGLWSSMEKAFYGAIHLVGYANDAPNLSQVVSMSYMFANAITFNQNISSWNTSNVRDMSYMFYNAISYNNAYSPLLWDTSSVENMSYMFAFAAVFNQNISSWDTSQVTNMNHMFYSTVLFNQDISLWTTSNVLDMSYMFNNAYAFNQNLNNWDVSLVQDMSHMFDYAIEFNSNIGSWDTSSVEDMNSMFFYASSYNNNGMPLSWNTGRVLDMSHMFYSALLFNQDVSSWNTSSVVNMKRMFYNSRAFDQDIGLWDTSSVVDMSYMFNNAGNFNKNISSWNTSNVLDMSYMFNNATKFNQNIGSWNTSRVTNMSFMFVNTLFFNQNISSWDTAEVTDMSYMFANARVFNQNIGSWNTSNVVSMKGMFALAMAFNQNLGMWSVSNVGDFSFMFHGITLSESNYDALLIGFKSQNLINGLVFNGGYSKSCSSVAQQAKNDIINIENWTFIDGGVCTLSDDFLSEMKNNINIFPNPVSNRLQIESKYAIENLRLFDINGKFIEEVGLIVSNTSFSYYLDHISSGIYFLNIQTTLGQDTLKIIKI
jgi:surface protein